MGGITTYTYNAADQIESIAEAANGIYGKETVTTQYYYRNGRLTTVTDKAGKDSAYGYDENGNIQTVKDPNGGTTTYAYDSMHRVTLVTDALNQTMASYVYNADGLLEEEKNGRNQKRTYSYDSLGRIQKVKDEEGTITYTYDANGNVETVKDKNGTITRTYDELNRVKTYTDYNGKTISYSYDELGNLISLTYPGGEIVRYTYDNTGNLETVTDSDGRVTRYSYDRNGRLSSTTRPDGSVESYTYNLAGKVTEAKDVKGDRVIHHYRYTYDLQGNITKIEGSETGVAETLTTVNMTYTKDNRLDTYNGQKIEYDKDGNMTYGPLNGVMTHFEYDCRNRLIKAGDTTYEYDAENTRIAVETKAKREEYVVNKNTKYSQVLSITFYEKNLLGQFTKETGYTSYTYGIGLISQKGREKQSDGSNKNSYYLYHFNQVGSTSQITDENGKVVYTYAYSPYGERMGTYDGAGTRISDDTPIRFLYNGQFGVETDENGLYYMRARYYNTDIKRFMNRDIINGSIENSQSLNNTYGIGLISQKGREKQSDGSNKNSYYLYHFNQVGSTSQITDENGKVVYTYAYSPYGERMGTYDGAGNRISDNTSIRFLYNGQLGVETDENGLYYMRARYYNTDIKRFMNRDIINGSIANSQSLNKYCYVQGNPVNLTDPFGLCPEGGGVLDTLKGWYSDLKNWYNNLPEHDQLALKGMIPFVGIFYDIENAILYAQEGNYTQAVLSALCAIPGLGDYAAIFKVGGIVLKTAKLAKLAKTAEVAATACRMAGVGGAVVASGASLAVSTGQAVNEYLDDGSVSGETMLSIGGSVLGLGMSAKALSKMTRWSGASGSSTIDNRLVNNSFFNNGERIATTKQIRNYKKQMKGMGINVVVDKKGKVLSGNKAAGFDYSTGTIYIKKKAGIIDLYHEGYHAEQYLRIGQENYVNLGMLAREEYVYSRIMENSGLFNDAELQGATKYIMRLRGK